MKTQNGWGVVLLAGGFSLLAISVAGATYFFENKPEKPGVVAVPNNDIAGVQADTAADWKASLERFTSSSQSGLSPTDLLGLKLGEEYANETRSEDERQEALSRLIAEYVPTFNSHEATVSLGDLSIRTEAALDVYAELTLIILRESARVREYELVSFSRAVREGNNAGIPELKEAATVYKRISQALVLVDVPPSVANEHLAVINSLGSLANIVSRMGGWTGDPLTGLSYLDSFITAENAVAASVETLFDAINKKEV